MFALVLCLVPPEIIMDKPCQTMYTYGQKLWYHFFVGKNKIYHSFSYLIFN